ncbi:MAG: hypothetical protein K9L85_02595 [Candidatus Peribacteraceae bacterium]|nr:hypothetical protein [Candidatus Peribacteraceae bacterium]
MPSDNIFAEWVNDPDPTVEDCLEIIKANSPDLSSKSGKVERWNWIRSSFIDAIRSCPNKSLLYQLYLDAAAKYSAEII